MVNIIIILFTFITILDFVIISSKFFKVNCQYYIIDYKNNEILIFFERSYQRSRILRLVENTLKSLEINRNFGSSKEILRSDILSVFLGSQTLPCGRKVGNYIILA